MQKKTTKKRLCIPQSAAKEHITGIGIAVERSNKISQCSVGLADFYQRANRAQGRATGREAGSRESENSKEAPKGGGMGPSRLHSESRTSPRRSLRD
jgi:hypothetical protein